MDAWRRKIKCLNQPVKALMKMPPDALQLLYPWTVSVPALVSAKRIQRRRSSYQLFILQGKILSAQCLPVRIRNRLHASVLQVHRNDFRDTAQRRRSLELASYRTICWSRRRQRYGFHMLKPYEPMRIKRRMPHEGIG